MRYIKTFESYSGCKSIDDMTIKFIDGNVSKSEYTNYLNDNVLNESIVSIVQNKIIDILYSFLTKAAKIGMSILNTFKSIFSNILKMIEGFREKHPSLYKVIMITILVMIILIISTSVAHAASTGGEVDPKIINIAIGFLEEHKQMYNDIDSMTINKAIANLINLRDGKIGAVDFGNEVQAVTNSAINTAKEIKEHASTSGDRGTMNYCLELLEKGSKFVSYTYKSIVNLDGSGSSEIIKLGIK